MLRSLKDLSQYAMTATDGDIGRVEDFLLDDECWTIRYLVAGTAGWLDGRSVLVSPISFLKADGATSRFHLNLTKEKIRNSPSVNVDKPVSRQHEREYSQYYGYSYYWGSGGVWGMGAYPGMLATGSRGESPAQPADPPGDPHLRSARELRGYHIAGTDDTIGHIEDFIVDDETWEVRYLVIDTSNWWIGKKVLVAPQWATRVSWEEREVFVALSRQAIQSSPEWDPNAAVNREYETRLYDYYGRPIYWDAGAAQAPKTAA